MATANKFVLISILALILSLGAALPAFAESEGRGEVKAGFMAELKARLFEERKDAKEERKEKRDERKEEMKEKREVKKEERKENKDDRKALFLRTHAGIVTSISGSSFTIDPFGKLATTTVTTNASTSFQIRGQATSTGALHVGSHVVVLGPLSTSTNTISANTVIVLNRGWGWIKHFFLR